jgi:hypothetical protein
MLEEEVLDLGCNLHSALNGTEAYLRWGQESSPFLNELAEHTEGSALLHLAKATEYRQLVVSHSHVGLLVRFYVTLVQRTSSAWT